MAEKRKSADSPGWFGRLFAKRPLYEDEEEEKEPIHNESDDESYTEYSNSSSSDSEDESQVHQGNMAVPYPGVAPPGMGYMPMPFYSPNVAMPPPGYPMPIPMPYFSPGMPFPMMGPGQQQQPMPMPLWQGTPPITGMAQPQPQQGFFGPSPGYVQGMTGMPQQQGPLQEQRHVFPSVSPKSGAGEDSDEEYVASKAAYDSGSSSSSSEEVEEVAVESSSSSDELSVEEMPPAKGWTRPTEDEPSESDSDVSIEPQGSPRTLSDAERANSREPVEEEAVEFKAVPAKQLYSDTKEMQARLVSEATNSDLIFRKPTVGVSAFSWSSMHTAARSRFGKTAGRM
ncbi:hypothetical protein J8273_5112 [Carpediemonas membranifera]|uniref:Uncharacterized protein n=1 Tax=Carpediemonas membranifera TaxID=201153 RepID=A0A8J6AZE9_9EUKA|nr:hypothetical protein J8273_5112 [Carpediemonas membranifera]|eukprot:KAG9392133.1 hypothetical protein J8273_5112 [Carpediemonas membranifera]